MSSTLRRFAQVPVRTGYFVALSGTDGPYDLIDAPALALKEGVSLSDLNTFVMIDDVADVLDFASFDGSALLKDLGQEIILVDSANNYYARYRNVLVVNGAASEGIAAPQTANILVRVWAAAGDNVLVARTG